MSKYKREFSAGGIVLRPIRWTQGKQAQDKFSKNKVEVLLTQHSTNKHWGFPKGLIDPGQTLEQAAIREVREEGGVEAEIVDKVGYSKYVYTLNGTRLNQGGEKIFKVVTYFLMRYISGDLADHDWEVSEAEWLQPQEALKKLTFSQDKQLLKKAVELYIKT